MTINSPANSAADFLQAHERKDMLRFLTCGSVDDGKSTLIGRLLYDSGNLYADQRQALEDESARSGNAGADIDFSLLVDGLEAEREQGITIDVAYRYFTTARRKFIIADTPGHEQYTRNMATGASTADLAIILIDARLGVLAQTRRHSFIVSQLGIRQILVAVNKLDLRNYDQAVFEDIVAQYRAVIARLPHPAEVAFVPVSALKGDNIVARSPRMPWYQGPAILEFLETVPVAHDHHLGNLLFPVQHVLRPHLDFRGFAGTLASGVLHAGQEVLALPSGQRSTVQAIHGPTGPQMAAFASQSVTVTLNSHIDLSRGDVLADPAAPPHLGTAFEAMLVWMDQVALQPGRPYLIKHLTNTVPGSIAEVRYCIDINDLEHRPAETLELNALGVAVIRLQRPVAFDLYANNRQGGAFIVIDRTTNHTVAAGMITRALGSESAHTRRLLAGEDGNNVVSGLARAARVNQRPATIWLRGPATETLAMAQILEKRLFFSGYLPYLLDLASLNVEVSRLLAFDPQEALDDIRRAVTLSRLCRDVGLVTLAVIAHTDADQQNLSVFLDEDSTPPSAGSAPDLSLDPLDCEVAVTAIHDLLRRRTIIGWYGDDVVI